MISRTKSTSMLISGVEFTCEEAGILQNSTTKPRCWNLQRSSNKWSDAVEECEKVNATIIEVTSDEDAQFAQTLMEDEGVEIAWIGGKEVVYPDWTWGVDEDDYTKWNTGEPKDGKHCALLTDRYKLQTKDCNKAKWKFNYICQINVHNMTSCNDMDDSIYAARNCYVTSKDMLTWYGAVSACADTYGGELVSLETKVMFDLVTKAMKAISLAKKFWVNFTRRRFTWNSGAPMTYFNWPTKGEPNDETHKCITMDKGLAYSWADYPCTTLFPFICVSDAIEIVEDVTVKQDSIAIDYDSCKQPCKHLEILGTMTFLELMLSVGLFVLSLVLIAALSAMYCKSQSPSPNPAHGGFFKKRVSPVSPKSSVKIGYYK